jgi:hypothetical protein
VIAMLIVMSYVFSDLITPFPALCNNSSCEAASTIELNCTAGFEFDPFTGICRPLCGWSPHLQQIASPSVNIITTFSYLMLIIFSSINLLLAFTIQRGSIL